MSHSWPQYKLRMPLELKRHIEDRARREGRSLNAEIVYRLNKTAKEDRELDEKLMNAWEALDDDQREIALAVFESVISKTGDQLQAPKTGTNNP